jgi:hypothetical protein
MDKARLVIILAAVFCLAPMALAEEWPPPNHERSVVYWSGTCNTSKAYNGHFEVDCEGNPYAQGARTGKWRHTSDMDCDLQYIVSNVYEVCTSGSSCSATSGTWVQITQQQFYDEYCP